MTILRSPAALQINEAVRPELVEFGSALLRAENIRQFHAGEASPRYGFTALANGLIDGTSPSVAYKMFADHNTVCRISDSKAEVFDSVSETWAAMNGRPSECSVSLIDFPSLGASFCTVEDTAVANGYVCVAWISVGATSDCYAAIVNLASGAVVSAPTKIGAINDVNGGATPCIATLGNVFIVLRPDVTGNTLQAFALDTSSAASITTGWVAMANLAADVSGEQIAVCSLTSTNAAVAYVNNSGGTDRLSVVSFNASGVIAAITVTTSSVTPAFVDIQGVSTDTLWVGWNENTNVKLCGLNPSNIVAAPLATTATILVAAVLPTMIGIQSDPAPGFGRLWVNEDNLLSMRAYTRGFQTTAGVAATNGSQNTIFAVRGAGRPTHINTRYYIPVIVADRSNLQQQIVLVDWTDDLTFLRPVADPAPGLSLSQGGYHARCSIAGTGADNRYYFGIAVAKSAAAGGTALVALDFGDTTRWQSAAWGDSVYLTGGVTSYSDGRRVAEAGFLVRPPLPTTGTSGTGITATSGWRYVCVYEEVDNDGNWHVSGLSNPSASTGPVANKTVTVSTAPLTVSGRISSSGATATGVRVAFYRTLDGGLAPYYRLGTSINDTTSANVNFADATADATLASASVLYSQPGVRGTAQDRRPPPGLSNIVSYNGMLVGSSGSDIWYSGQSVSGEGAWFNPIFQVPIPGDGDIMALAVMDGGLFAFKRREVYSLVGSPPSDNGATGGIGTPARLACDVGCIEARSICTTALGIFFQSDRGIEMLTRAQTVTWIGQKIQTTLAAYPIVTSATVQPTPSGAYVIIEIAATQSAGLVTGTGRALIFDLSINEWISVDRRNSVTGAVDAPSQSACMIYTNTAAGFVWRYAWMSTTGSVHYENRATYLDADGSFTTQIVETGWYNAFQNETRVEVASVRFDRYEPAGLMCETAYNDEDYTGKPDAVAAWSEDDTGRQNQLEWKPSPRGEKVKFRITATAPAAANFGTGQGIGFISVLLDTAAKQGPTKGSIRLDPALRK